MSSSPADGESKSAQEVLNGLQKTYRERKQAVTDIKDQLIAAQDSLYKAFEALSGTSEQLMINVIENQNSQLKALKPPADEQKSN